ncbi:MAG: SHOCT domain-containing protein [Ornithinimicrobium sp.]
MPGLLRGVARTAAIAGTATAVSGRVQRRQNARWAARDTSTYEQPAAQQYAPPAAAQPMPAAGGSGDATIDQLKELAELRAQGILSDAEFTAQKARILAS